MQKLTRALSRALEVGGVKLTLTLSAAGVELAPADTEDKGLTLSWGGVLCAAAAGEPNPAALAEVLRRFSAGPAAPTPPVGELLGVLTRLDTWFAQHRKRFHEGLRPGASAAECDALGESLGRPLPTELRTLLSWHNGQDPDVPGGFEESWRLMSADQIAPAKVDLDAAGNQAWQPTYIPFLENDRGDCLCLDSAGPVRAFWGNQPEAREEAPSLTAWFTRFLSDVEAGRYHEDPERGSFLRS
jgi:cell wall assembly regulator SMI1